MSNHILLETGAMSEVPVSVTGFESTANLVRKRTLKHLARLAFNDWAVLRVLICTVHLTVCFSHVTYAFQRESTFYSCLKIIARIRCDIWSLRTKWFWAFTNFIKKGLQHRFFLVKFEKFLRTLILKNIC